MKAIIAMMSIFFAASAIAGNPIPLGKQIVFNQQSDGTPTFGVQYTYGDDPDGKSYLLTFMEFFNPTEQFHKSLWNFYAASSSKFLLPWDQKRFAQLPTIQIMTKENLVVEALIKGQGNQEASAVYFVLANPTTLEPEFYVPLSQLCLSMPTHFSDLTNGQRCDKIKNP